MKKGNSHPSCALHNYNLYGTIFFFLNCQFIDKIKIKKKGLVELKVRIGNKQLIGIKSFIIYLYSSVPPVPAYYYYNARMCVCTVVYIL